MLPCFLGNIAGQWVGSKDRNLSCARTGLDACIAVLHEEVPHATFRLAEVVALGCCEDLRWDPELQSRREATLQSE